MFNLTKTILEHGGRCSMVVPHNVRPQTVGNPTIVKRNGKFLLSYRSCDNTFIAYRNKISYAMTHAWYPNLSEFDVKYGTRNIIGEFDLDKMTFSNDSEYLIDEQPYLKTYNGYEDVRLVEWNGELVAAATHPNLINSDKFPICINVLNEDYSVKKRWHCGLLDVEKNWMPIVDRPYEFVWSTTPTVVVNAECENVRTVVENNDKYDVFYKGNTQVVPYEDYYIGIVHRNETKVVNNMTSYSYVYRFAIWDKNLKLVKLTEEFSFSDNCIEFCCGMHVDENNVVIPFSVFDTSAYVLRFDKNILDWLVGLTEEPNKSNNQIKPGVEKYLAFGTDADSVSVGDSWLECGNVGGALSIYTNTAAKTSDLGMAKYAYEKALYAIKDFNQAKVSNPYISALIAEDRIIDQIRFLK